MSPLPLGSAIGPRPSVPPPPATPDPDPTTLLLTEVRAAMEMVAAALAELAEHRQVPPPVPAPSDADIGEIVTAVMDLKPGATADDIADAVVSKIAPPPPPDQAMGAVLPVLAELREALEKLDFRMQGLGRAFGSAGTVSVAEQTVNVESDVTVTADTVGLAKEATLLGVRRGTTDFRSLLDYGARTDGNPVYVGKNLQAALTSASDWVIQRLAYDASDRVTDVQVLTGVWDDRASLGWT